MVVEAAVKKEQGRPLLRVDGEVRAKKYLTGPTLLEIDGDGNPDLRLDRVFRGAEERLDVQMLFDPAKKQLHAPASTIQFGNGECGEQEVVGQKNQPQIFLGVEVMDATQRVGIQVCGLRPGELNGLIGSQAGGTAHRSPVASPELRILLGARDEESATLFEHVKTGEVQVSAVEQIKSPRFG